MVWEFSRPFPTVFSPSCRLRCAGVAVGREVPGAAQGPPGQEQEERAASRGWLAAAAREGFRDGHWSTGIGCLGYAGLVSRRLGVGVWPLGFGPWGVNGALEPGGWDAWMGYC